MKFKLVEDFDRGLETQSSVDTLKKQTLNELTRPQRKAAEISRINPARARVTVYENEIKVHSVETGKDYDIILQRDPVVTKSRTNVNKLRFNGNGTVRSGTLYDASGTALGPAFYGYNATHNVYDYIVRCDDEELPMSHTQFINQINSGRL